MGSNKLDETVVASGGTIPIISGVTAITTGTIDVGGRVTLEPGELYDVMVETYDCYISVSSSAVTGTEDCTSDGYRLYAGTQAIPMQVDDTNKYVSHLTVATAGGTLKFFKRTAQLP